MPKLPGPDSLEFELLMLRLQDSEYPFVGIGRRWGPRLPQIRPPAPRAPALEDIDGDMERVQELTSPWAQPWFQVATRPTNGVVDSNRDEILEHVEERERTKPRLKPSSHLALCMWASCWWHLGAFDDEQLVTRFRDDQLVGKLLNLSGDAGLSANRNRFRSLPRTISKGDHLWSSLGVWPWAAFPAAQTPAAWWTREEAHSELASAIHAYSDWLEIEKASAVLRVARSRLKLRRRIARSVAKELGS